MKKKRFNCYAAFMLAVTGCFFLLCADFSVAAQCFIVNIAKETKEDQSQIYLRPSELKVPKGACVIWVSWVDRENVNINFHANSKSCIRASGANTGFMEVEGCFISDSMNHGQTVSLYFKEAGTFGYQLEILEKAKAPGGGAHRVILREGKVIVE
ncbi:MAG: hypothetical protein V2B19_30570 [Pseudomonadota bacterium]